MKNVFAILAFLFSAHAHACFSLIGYEENWNKSIDLLLISLAIGILALFIRVNRKVKYFYIPIIILLVSNIPSAIEIIRYGNGDCSLSLIQVAIWPVYVMSVVLLYEFIKLVKLRLGASNS